MNINKFFTKAKEENIEVSELSCSSVTSTDISVFRGEVENNTLSSTNTIRARGIYNGKMGASYTEKDDSHTIDFLIKEIKSGAQYIERKEDPIIFEGSKKYVKRNLFFKELAAVPATDKIKLLLELEKYTKSLDERIYDVQLSYSDTEESSIFTNSYGLKLKSHNNYFYVYMAVYVRDGEQVKVNGDIHLDTDFYGFDYKTFAKKCVDDTVSLLHGKNFPDGTYKAVLKSEVFSSLLNAALSHASSESVQKKTSKFIGKLNTQVFSPKLTVSENPLDKNVFFHNFDDEGVATFNKKVIEKGVLKTYFYNLENAKKDGVESTGNGRRQGSKIGISFSNLVVKPGRLSQQELFEKVNKGIYLTSIQGLHAGLNSTSGDFSLQAEGYRIEDGKITGALDLFTVSGNVFTLLNDILAIGNDSKLLISSNNVPSVAIKHIKISGQ